MQSKYLGALGLITCLSQGYSLPLPSSKTILISPDNIRYYASFIHSTATINDLTIQFSGMGGAAHEELCIPLTAAEELTPQSLIHITGVYSNQFQLTEDATSSTVNVNPCDVVDGMQNGRLAPAGNPVAGGYTLLFDPSHQFGSCTANNGFTTNGRFNSRIDASKGLNLVVHRDDINEQSVYLPLLSH